MTEEAICLHCSGPIAYRTFGSENWEPDYDPSFDSEHWRHANGYSACLTEHFAKPRPRIVCLCGSTRFYEAFQQANYDLTMAGQIVLTVGCDTKLGPGLGITDEQKVQLDELHKRKIDLADRVFVLNVHGYIGESTRSEIDYATAHGKPVEYLEAVDS